MDLKLLIDPSIWVLTMVRNPQKPNSKLTSVYMAFKKKWGTQPYSIIKWEKSVSHKYYCKMFFWWLDLKILKVLRFWRQLSNYI